ncbi:MAG: lipocalin family protein [Bacteroidales bacterium]|nr:lipocalin family protein [Bacteroidales bacterium]
MKTKHLIIIILLAFTASFCSAQENYEKTAKLIHGTWQLDSLYIGGQNLPEPLMRKVYEKMRESNKFTTYNFSEDGKYINATKASTTEGTWELSQSADTLTLILPDKTITNKILQISSDSLSIEPQNETKEVENCKIFMVRKKEDAE